MSHRSFLSTRFVALSIAASIASCASATWAQSPPAAPPAVPPAGPPSTPSAGAAPPAAWTEETPPAPAPATPPEGVAPGTETAPAAPPADAAAEGGPIGIGASTNPSDSAYTPEPERPLTKHAQYDLGFEVGVRNVVATDPSYDPYSTDDLLTSFALAATWMPLHVDALSFGLVGEWNPGGSTGVARGDATSVFIHRASVGAQARLALGRRVYLSAKVAPAILAVSGNIHDPAISRPLEADAVTWGLDATGGAAVLIARAGDPDAPAFRLWIVGEVGYAFAGSTEMSHTPEVIDEDPRRYGGIALAALDTSGVVNRFGVALTF